MKTVSQWISALVCLCVVAFCVFGFMATFEPLPPAKQWTWRVIYGVLVAGSLSGLVSSLHLRREADKDHES